MNPRLTCGIAVPVDVVFTWVNGADPAWRADFERWVTVRPTDIGPDACHPARYRDNGELRFALRSVWRYARWVRHIHVVSAGHTPAWLRADDERIRLVSHEQICGPTDLPTFNSHAIEARLHHTPGLAEHFIYLNDDVFFAQTQPSTNYFDATGTPLVPIAPRSVPRRIEAHSASCDHGAANGIRLIESDLGQAPHLRPRHGPLPQRRSHLFELESRFRPELMATAATRFRSSADISLPTFLAPMHGLITGRTRCSPARVDELNVDDADLVARLVALGPDTAYDAFCLNDTERVTLGPDGTRCITTTFLHQRFVEPAPWEIRPSDVATSDPGCGVRTEIG